MDENNCDSNLRARSPEKKAISASVGSYASVLKGREKNKMSGKLSGIIESQHTLSHQMNHEY